jgi:cytoskeletal protein CcmA (bactofilin family)
MFNRRRDKRPNIETLIGAGTRINGDLTFRGGLHLEGVVNGSVTAEGAAGDFLSVSEDACIEGAVMVPNIVLHGLVKGGIHASQRIKLGPRARVLGDVTYNNIETEIGAQINGKLIHKPEPEAGERNMGTAAGESPPADTPVGTPSL